MVHVDSLGLTLRLLSLVIAGIILHVDFVVMNDRLSNDFTLGRFSLPQNNVWSWYQKTWPFVTHIRTTSVTMCQRFPWELSKGIQSRENECEDLRRLNPCTWTCHVHERWMHWSINCCFWIYCEQFAERTISLLLKRNDASETVIIQVAVIIEEVTFLEPHKQTQALKSTNVKVHVD